MLDPRQRTLLFEALRPPDGYALHSAVGTTYSLDLMALLAAPLAFTIFDCEDRDGRVVMDPLVLLEALRQHARRVTIFCQAGRIAVPRQHRPLLGYLENSVVEAVAPNREGSFHPKVWALRFEHNKGPVRYRLLCLSRNLTFDRSWDTALVLDGELTDRTNAFADNHPIGDFFQALPGMAVQEVSPAVEERLDLIQGELRRVKFELPPGFEGLRFWPCGLTGRKTWPFPNSDRRMMVVSPFVTNGILKDLSEGRKANVLVSREEALDGLNPATLEGFTQVFAMAPEAEPDGPGEGLAEGDEKSDSLSGLHAKLFVMDDGYGARMWTGSANATEAAFSRNIELLVELRGKKSQCGIDAVLGGDDGRASLLDLLRPYSVPDEKPPPIDGRLEKLAEDARRELARAGLWLVADEAGNEGTWCLAVMAPDDVAVSLPKECAVRCWPVSLAEDHAVAFEPGASPVAVLQAVSWQALTTFMAFSVKAIDEDNNAEVRFVLNLPLEGGPANRQERLLEQVLTDRAAVLRFLLLLLADDVKELSAVQNGSLLAGCSDNERLDLAIGMPLFESLVRALDRDPARLDRVDRLMKELSKSESGRKLLPEGFDELWASIWKARQEVARG
jgi:hypothetical protein